MHEVSLAFFWHQHQPYYPDDVAGENPMPWVRLHGTKDYWGMAMLLKEAPEMHATINLVPSLLQQLSAYTDGGHQDAHQRVSRCRRRPERRRHVLPAGQFLHGPSGPDDPAVPALSRVVQEARPGDRFGREGPQAIQQERHDRPAMLVEPGVDPSAGLRAGRRAGRVPQQGARLDGEGKAVAVGQADGTAPAGRAAAPGTDRIAGKWS